MNKLSILTIAFFCLLSANSRAQNLGDMNEKQETLRKGDVTINYSIAGQGDTTVLFLHGWCISRSYWQSQMQYFKPNYTVCAIDLPGFGKSTAQRKDWTIEEYAKDVIAFIKTTELKNVILIGHSMAGNIMVQTALEDSNQIIGLIGVDNFKVLDVEFTPEQMEQMTSYFPLLQSDFATNVALYADQMLFHPETDLKIKTKIKQDLSASDPVIAYNTLMNQMSFSQQQQALLEQLPYTLHLINSSGYPTNRAGLANHCKSGFVLKEIDGTGHYPMIENPDEFNRLLKEIVLNLKQKKAY